jgi:hypothetical protein
MPQKLWIAILAAPIATLSAQSTPAWQAVGTPSGAPAGCSTQAAAASIDAFFVALRTADSTALAQATAPLHNGEFDFSMGKFSTPDPGFRAHTVSELLPYARSRARQHERIAVQHVTFNYWRGHRLGFGPIYYLRSADDLGSKPRAGIGKGEYWCGKGIFILYMGPRPAFDPGPSP